MLLRKIPLKIYTAKSRHLCLAPNLRGDAFSLSPLNMNVLY